jgi:hypothetical protein
MSRPTRAETPGKPVRVRLSDAEHERAIQAARANHQNLSAFVRDAIVTAASECLEDQPAWARCGPGKDRDFAPKLTPGAARRGVLAAPPPADRRCSGSLARRCYASNRSWEQLWT